MKTTINRICGIIGGIKRANSWIKYNEYKSYSVTSRSAKSNVPVNGVQSPVQQSNGVSAGAQKTPGVMGKDDFLKLFLSSFQHQDPFNAMDMNQMMNQTAQLSLMEQVQNMTKAVDKPQSTMYSTALDGGMKF